MNSINYPKKEEKALKLAKKRFALISWVKDKLVLSKNIMEVFNPFKREDVYTNLQAKEYLRYAQMKAVLEDSLLVLESSKSTQQMYDNVDYTLCKLYNIKYLEEFETYEEK